MKSILITGGTGYVGRKVVRAILKDENIKIALVVRNIDSARQLFDNKKIVLIDLKNDDWKDNMKIFNPEIVLHLAAHLTSNDNENDINDLIQANIHFGSQLLDALKNCNTRLFINTGSYSEYRKEDLLEPAYFYAATKTAFRSILKYYQKLLGFKVIHAIPYSIYGGEKEGKKVIDYLFESKNKQISMTPGEQILDFIHIEDIVSFYTMVIRDERKFSAKEYTFFLGTGKGTTIKELARIIEKKHKILLNIIWGGIEYRQMDIMYAVAPVERNVENFWKSQISLEEGILKYD